MNQFTITNDDALHAIDLLKHKSIDLIFTSPSPPFSVDIGIGSEPFVTGYIHNLVYLFSILKSKLKDTGSLFIQIGDYHDNSGNLRCVPERLMIELQKVWILRNKLIWHRPDVVHADEPNRFYRNWEYLLWFTKNKSGYVFKNTEFLSSIFSIRYKKDPNNKYSSGFPEGIIELIIKWCTNPGDVILDPLCGAGTTGKIALRMDRNFIGIEIDKELAAMANEQLKQV